MRERQRERQTDRQRLRKRQTDRDRHTHIRAYTIQTDKGTDRDRSGKSGRKSGAKVRDI